MRWLTLSKVQQSALPPPPTEKTNSTALLLSASSGSFALLGGRGDPQGGELLGNASLTALISSSFLKSRAMEIHNSG
jgi:hypothetical protein